MLINTFLDTEDFVHLYYPEDETPAAQGCGAGARLASKYPRPPSPDFKQSASSSAMSERDRYRAPPQPEPPPHRVRASDLYPRTRPHLDEPGLEAGFATICGEFVQFIGRTSDGGTIAMSNYRLHLQPRRRTGSLGSSVPLRLIEALEIRDLLCLIILCKHGRQLKCSFNTGDQCVEWWRRLNTALVPVSTLQETFAAAYAAWAKEQPNNSVHRALMRASQPPQRHWFKPELDRLGFTMKGAWRVSAANVEYKLCGSYPPLLVVPASVGDDDLESVARFRAMRRIPAVVWRHRVSGGIIARSSQPEVGWLGWRSAEDERLLAAFVHACNQDRPIPNKQLKLLIVDARSYASAVTNRARGGGCECAQYYPAADIQFMSLPNIHHVRRSFQQLRALAAEPPDQPNWHSSLERTLWPQYVSGVLRAAAAVSRAAAAGRPVLVHCSDGWDRTPQLVAAAQIILDPHYRTIEGFRTLIEREWLDFGHKFGDRCGHSFGGEDPNERSPVFLQWLHCIYQLMLQYPCSFEFNEAYLIKLAVHVHSCMFGTFLCNSSRERVEYHTAHTAQVWRLLSSPAYRNHLYTPHEDQVIWPECSVRSMQVWWGVLLGEREREPPRHNTHVDNNTTNNTNNIHNGLMTKTRSCDNLHGGEKKTTQRRCSDPSLAPDIMKLSLLNGSEIPDAQTDTDTDQVDGLHPDHFDNHLRDITSNSSSLERELVSMPPVTLDAKEQDNLTNSTDNDEPNEALTITTITTIDTINHDDLKISSSNHDIMNRDAMELSTLNNDPVNHTPASPCARLEVDSPEEPAVFVCETYTDVIGMAEAARESARTRNISITWRSISESSNQSSTGFDIGDNSPQTRLEPATRLDPQEINNHNSTDGDVVNHNIVTNMTNHNRGDGLEGVNGVADVTNNFLEVDLNACASPCSSSDSCCEAVRGSSQLTLCPATPPHTHGACCACSSEAEEADETLEVTTAARTGWSCSCGGARAVEGCRDSLEGVDGLDGLPLASDPVQARLHQIILQHKKMVEDLNGQLREAREALRRASGVRTPAAVTRPPHAQSPTGVSSSCVTCVGPGAPGGSSSGSSSASELEVCEEARVRWLPDAAAPRCQHCRNSFWLARRRHHCR
nr:myotubularin-related protein 3 isoform X2 [Danaus plexippus plexippus]